MYSTCLFCNGSLGANAVIEVFPVGRRLAFDPAKGRLWVICRKCERWNLSPLEERWEAIEECERSFSDTRLRTSTANIGLARLKEGLELVRIGAPQRPEFAAWRYGDQFGRRRRDRIIRIGVAGTALGGVAVGIVTAGIAAGASMGGAWWMLVRGASAAYERVVNGSPKEIVAQVPVPGGTLHPILRRDLGEIGILQGLGPGLWQLKLPVTDESGKLVEGDRRLTGENAIRAAGVLLPALNASGANPHQVSTATELVERAAGSVSEIFDLAAAHRERASLLKLDAPLRLALEMAAHEESERRALEGELAVLEAAWKQAEEIAGIADDMFLPPEIEERIRKAHPE